MITLKTIGIVLRTSFDGKGALQGVTSLRAVGTEADRTDKSLNQVEEGGPVRS